MNRFRLLGIFLLLWSTPVWAEVASAPLFTLKNLQGEDVKLESFLGKVVVLDFWAVYCPPCRDEIPGFINIRKEFGEKGVEIVGISVDQSPDRVAEFVKEQQIPYPILMGNKDVSQLFGGINAIPTTILIDRNLNLVKKHVGFVEQKVFAEEIRQLLTMDVATPTAASGGELLGASPGESVPVRQDLATGTNPASSTR